MASQEERRKQTRNKIIQAARRLFDQQGFEKTSVEQIVTRANVAKGTFYQYYTTKIEVLTDVVRDEGAEKFRAALEAMENGEDALKILDRFIKAQCEWFEAHEKVASAIIHASLQSVGNEITEKDRHSRVFMARLMTIAQKQGTIRADLDPKEISKIIGGALVVSVLIWSQNQNPQPGALHASMKQSLDIALNGARSDD